VSLKNRIYLFFSKGHERTLLAKKNIAYSFLLKGLSILTGLLLIPMTIKYVNSAQYGIWLTLSSIIGWMSFFDIGLGNGLKNKLAEANALKQYSQSRIFVSTTYAIMSIITVFLFLVFLIANPYINWNSILNTSFPSADLSRLALLVFSLFCLQFVIQIINSVLTACHLVAKVSLILLIGQIIMLIAIYCLIRFTQSSLLLLVLINGATPVIIQLLASIWYYRHELKYFAPSFKLIDFNCTRELLSLGGLFFVIQIGALVLFQTDNIVIIQLFGPAQVTAFNVAYKLFSVLILGFNIIITPFWSAFTDAYANDDLRWINSTMMKMRYLWLFISAGSILLLFLAPYIYQIWLNNSVTVPSSLSAAMAFYIIVYSWQTIHVYLLNGINKIRLQFYLVIISAVINIPLAIFLGRKIGLTGVTLSNAVLFLIMGLIFSFQTKRILNNTAKGILNA
jgi:O-antigen/teichoic acid export membrane protein